uniref:Uncharacterized protein n=1 Tax=viral metagenome TaxID=1070528 RepID=A0A6M3LTF7_9ZZZZ
MLTWLKALMMGRRTPQERIATAPEQGQEAKPAEIAARRARTFPGIPPPHAAGRAKLRPVVRVSKATQALFRRVYAAERALAATRPASHIHPRHKRPA